MAVARAGFVSIDCAEAGPLAAFWAAMLGGDVAFTGPGTADVRNDWVWISAMEVPGYTPPTWPAADIPKQIHLDLAVDDLEASTEAALRLGATLADVQPHPDHWRVLLDPAGHPFCLTTMIPPEARS
ncbi:MAG TPA: VOC family protein [Acidimicrobiales bacterium]|nr:VOC family protein [Acidimicrobiales bacterium]